MGQKREKRGRCSNCGQEEKKQVGAKERKKGKMLQLCTGGREACWGGSDKTEENAQVQSEVKKQVGEKVAEWGKLPNK